ncbi:MAG TPA: thiamine-phosphate kinase [bacterium]|nr:thiamine-phosphate kinase [bacterium]
MRIGQLGEFGLIERIRNILQPQTGRIRVGIGDDAAVFSVRPGHETVLSTDALVEGVHFDFNYTPLDALGWKALAVNLSDLAAMAADPVCAVVSMAFPDGWTVEDIEALCQGLHACGETHGCPVAGGDTARSPGAGFISLTVVGEAPEGKAVLRSGAGQDDLICVTGRLGRARTGFEVLSAGSERDAYPESVRHFLRPEPRLDLAKQVVSKLSVTAMIDISDGLAADLGHLCRAGGLGCRIDGSALPIHPEAVRWMTRTHQDPEDFILGSGEEYELLFTVPRDREGRIAALQAEACPLAVIGEMRPASEGQKRRTPQGEKPLSVLGWDHFRE